MAKRKKKALEDLLAKSRMSRPTYEHLLKGIEDEIVRLEDHRRSLAKNMAERAEELQRQINLIEMFLACLELRRIGREIDESSYAERKEVLVAGLEATREELMTIQRALAEIGK
jgi:chromosome segregation ATPase